MNELQLNIILNAIKEFKEIITEEIKLMRKDFINYTSIENQMEIIKGYFSRIQKMLKSIFNRVKW